MNQVSFLSHGDHFSVETNIKLFIQIKIRKHVPKMTQPECSCLSVWGQIFRAPKFYHCVLLHLSDHKKEILTQMEGRTLLSSFSGMFTSPRVHIFQSLQEQHQFSKAPYEDISLSDSSQIIGLDFFLNLMPIKAFENSQN